MRRRHRLPPRNRIPDIFNPAERESKANATKGNVLKCSVHTANDDDSKRRQIWIGEKKMISNSRFYFSLWQAHESVFNHFYLHIAIVVLRLRIHFQFSDALEFLRSKYSSFILTSL